MTDREPDQSEDCGHPILDTIGKMAVRIRELERQRDLAEETLTRVETERLAAVAEAARLKQALRDYGAHEARCEYFGRCECGLEYEGGMSIAERLALDKRVMG